MESKDISIRYTFKAKGTDHEFHPDLPKGVLLVVEKIYHGVTEKDNSLLLTQISRDSDDLIKEYFEMVVEDITDDA